MDWNQDSNSTGGSGTLKDSRELQAVDSPEYDAETGFYELERFDGSRVRVNKDDVLTIRDMK
ncbi:YgdI/YgdR family lipoprotein [Azotobacter armeniacus]